MAWSCAGIAASGHFHVGVFVSWWPNCFSQLNRFELMLEERLLYNFLLQNLASAAGLKTTGCEIIPHLSPTVTMSDHSDDNGETDFVEASQEILSGQTR